jgi:zinc transporter ZupT
MLALTPEFYSIVLFLVALGGGLIFFLSQKQFGQGLKLMLAFSAAYLLGLTLLHLFPELFESGISNPGWYVLGGFMLQVVLDFFSHGVEHGHAHSHSHAGSRFFFTVMASLWIHAFIEGMPFGGGGVEHVHEHAGHAHTMHDHRGSLLIGISLHKITESLVFVALMMNSGMKKKNALIFLVLFALVAPAGLWTQHLLGTNGLADLATLTPKVTGVLIGIILHVATTILFESEEGHRFNWMKFAAILAGIAMAAAIA